MSTCILCGSSNSRESIFGGYRYKGIDFYLTRCLKCGFLYLEPIPDDRIIKDMYSDASYFDNYWVRNSSTLGYENGKEVAMKSAEKTLRVIKNHKEKGSIVDIGCAGGHFLNKAKEMGYETFGIEPNKQMADHAKNAYTLDVANNTFCEIGPMLSKFDIVYLGDTLEHIQDLDLTLKIARDLMQESSILVVEGPLTYNRSLYNLFLSANMAFKKSRLSDNKPFHIWEFDRSSMRKFLKKHGLEIVYLRITEDLPRFVKGIDGKSPKGRLNRFIKNISRMASNNALIRWLELGDRIFVIARKA